MLTGIRAFVLLLLVVSLAACQSNPVTKLYDGPERPVTELVTVHVPETLEILSVNGQRPSGIGNRLVTVDRVVHFSPGRYEIVAFYKDIWTPAGTNVHVVLRSEPVVFDIEGAAGSGFSLEYQTPENHEAARKLSEDFSGWSRNTASGERVATRPSGVERPSLLSSITGGSAAPSSAISSSTTHSSATNSSSVTPNTTKVIEPASTAAPAATKGVDAQQDNSYLDMLKAYWSQASQEERRAFLRWVAE